MPIEPDGPLPAESDAAADANDAAETSPADAEPSADAPAEMTPEELAEAKQYSHERLICSLVDMGIDVVYLMVAAFLLARPLDAWLSQFGLFQSLWLRLIGIYAVVIGLHLAISFPLSWYSGHRLEHKYGLSRQTLGRWLRRYAAQNALSLGFGLLMMQGVYWLIWLAGPWWWLCAAGCFFLVSVILGQLMPVLILPLFYKIKRIDEPALAGRFATLAADTGLRIEGIYRMDMSAETAKANAVLAGLGSTRRVILGDTLLDEFSEDEIAVVLAHEIGHHVHKHIPQLIVVGLLMSTAGFWLCDQLLAAWVTAQTGPFSYANFPVWTLPMLMLIVSVSSLLVGPLQNALSRRFERQADAYALWRTNLPAAYRSAYLKLARQNKEPLDPPALEVFLFHSHPALGDRIRAADG